ncbi:MAG: glycosyl hydrolase [Dysgonomonas sp.]|uniref:glycosyl hydrolase n=1 Tax=Dysgonomonas sp. TaxID=1891233 RepID=UPI0039E6A3DA
MAGDIKQLWSAPPKEAKPWVFWYWMQGAVSKEGITADLEAMKQNGIAGAYLMPIKGVPEKPWLTPSVEQLSPLWWEMVKYAFTEADRLGLEIGFHICDGFALAGGPWITPELSMQKVVWKSTQVSGGKQIDITLPQPESYKEYYKDIAIFAYPTPKGENVSSYDIKPKVSTSIPNTDAQFLAIENNEENFRSESPCWIQYTFDSPFTCRTIQVIPSGNNFQAQRLTIESSDDGIHFRKIIQLTPPRQGWQNQDFAMTHSIPETTARYFRFVYDKEGSEPGSEDLDAAKWKQSLKIKGIQLSSDARINQFEGKNGSVWRVSPRTTDNQIPNSLSINQKYLIDITQFADNNGKLNWKAPKGNWTILRMGHTSTGHTNATGGKGAGLESDKFNPEAIRLQFDSWFGKALDVAGKDLASRVVKVFHVDSWECGSQNWSPVFRNEFKKRRGYDLVTYLPVMAGIPINSADFSERVLYDVRQTISELVVDKFYKELKTMVNERGIQFSAENVSPTMLSDGMLHYQHVDIPMNEFWLQSPTHDKPNDVLDAVSGAHIYGKNIIQAESFTQLRTMWNETPAMVKSLQDREYALGINKLSYHVYVHNPWLDRKPGMTLDGIGFYFQRDQTWWNLGRAWVDYATRCHALLQYGKPVVDIAVFTGEELPRRALLPDRLVPFLPGLFDEEKVKAEKIRLANVGTPSHQMPVGVNHSSNITDASQWVNALRGYHYDSFNADALIRLATAKEGKIVLPDGLKYDVLVIPGKHPMQPDADYMSQEVANKITELVKSGCKVMINELPDKTTGVNNNVTNLVWNNSIKNKTIALPYTNETLENLGVARDFIAIENNQYAKDIAFTHRKGSDADIYFISNQKAEKRNISVSLRESGRNVELWNPVTAEINSDVSWEIKNNRTVFNLDLDENESVFVVLQTPTDKTENKSVAYRKTESILVNSPWSVQFDTTKRGIKNAVEFKTLTDWSENTNDSIKYYSGEAIYMNRFTLSPAKDRKYIISFDEIHDLAEVKVNGISCGIIWTKPYSLDITKALKDGANQIKITVANTWANRMMGDEDFGIEKDEKKKIWTNARYRLPEKKLVKSGLVGNVTITEYRK